ncbi:MAG: MmgE/PrpD family protein [Chloroflexota bacterium]
MSVTRTLSDYLISASSAELPDWVLHESKRTLLNMLAISVSASVQKPVLALTEWARAQGSTAQATAIGSGLRTSAFNAAQVNGYAAHLQDYDDTHFPTVLHPTAPVWPAVLAAAEVTGASGRDALAAFALGAEAACRIAMSVHPWHYDTGWHITGTAGVFGAAAGAGRLLGLDAGQLVYALGAAGTQAAGVREVFGSDAKALHAAKAAANGLQAVQLAKAGFTAADDIIGGRRGFWAVLSPNGHDEAQLTGRLGEHWELGNNGLKPYANGVVSHPIQDAVIRLRNEHSLKAEQVGAITARVNPLVLELMNRPEPRRGLEGKFSFQHCAAAALVDGAGHDAQFSDAKVADPVISALRAKVSAKPEEGIEEDEVYLAIRLTDGRTVETHVEHATGSPSNPMSDEVLTAKYTALTAEVLGAAQTEALRKAVWSLNSAPDVREVARLMARKG